MRRDHSQQRAQERAGLVRALEQKTRGVVEADQALARSRAEQAELRTQLLKLFIGSRKRRQISARTIDTARAVEAGAFTASAVAEALGITIACARARLQKAIEANLVDRVAWGRYATPSNCFAGDADESA